MCVYQVEYESIAEQELAAIGPFYGRQIAATIAGQLTTEPTVASRSRKKVEGLKPPFKALPPVWELRVGEYRVFYDVNEDEKKVYVRAVRHKPPHKTTEEIL